jgi:predicted nuclease with RNAse H fold
LISQGIVGIDLAPKSQNPSRWAIWKSKSVSTSLVYTDNKIMEGVTHNKPITITIDAPFHIPNERTLRKAGRELMKAGYRVFPQCLTRIKNLLFEP